MYHFHKAPVKLSLTSVLVNFYLEWKHTKKQFYPIVTKKQKIDDQA